MGLVRMSKAQLRRHDASVRRHDATPVGRREAALTSMRKPYPGQIVAFELDEEIPEEHDPDDEYDALIRDWDPTQHSGKGAYVTGATTIVVRDTREVGYYGASGHKGMCKIRFTSTGSRFGEIIDMECP